MQIGKSEMAIGNLVECVPNFSEGAIAKRFAGVCGDETSKPVGARQEFDPGITVRPNFRAAPEKIVEAAVL